MRAVFAGLLLASLGLNAWQWFAPSPPARPDRNCPPTPEPVMAAPAASVVCPPPPRCPAPVSVHPATVAGAQATEAARDTSRQADTVEAWRASRPVMDLLHAQAVEAYGEQLAKTFGRPIKPVDPKVRARSTEIHMRDATAAMQLTSPEAERYAAWFEVMSKTVEEAHQSGDRARHLDALIKGFIAEDAWLEAQFGTARARQYVDARLDHRIFVLAGVAAAADVDPYEAIRRYQGN